MFQIILKPLIGIEIENLGHVKLGHSRREVEHLLGEPKRTLDNSRCFYSYLELRIDYDNVDTVEFIEFISGPSQKNTRLLIFETDPFATEAEKLVEILRRENNGRVDDSEAPYAYAFLNISVGVWRNVIPSEIEIEVANMKREGNYKENEERIHDDFVKSQRFWTIGIGQESYYD